MKLLCFCCGAFLLLAFSCHAPASSIDDLKSRIQKQLQQQKAEFSVAFKDLSTGKTLFINEHESFHAASTMKTPVMIEIYRQSELGIYALTDSMLIANEFRSIADSSSFKLDPKDDSELELYQHLGEKRSIDSLVYLMITKSSNLATNLLVDRAGAKQVSETMAALGAMDIHVLRGVEDNKAYEKGMNNTVTAYDLMLLFDKMANHTLVSARASDEMIRILLGQTFNEIIPAQLPATVKVAHKTGWFKTVNHDGGIVFLPDGRKYVLVLLSKNAEQDQEAVKTLASVSKQIFDYASRRP